MTTKFAVVPGAGATPRIDVDEFNGQGVLTTDSSVFPFSFDPTFKGGESVAELANGNLAVGQGPGGASLVSFYSPAGASNGTFQPFGASYTGGVDVAWLDPAHLAISTLAGAAPVVQIYDATGETDGSTGVAPALTGQFVVFDPTYQGGVDVAWVDKTHLAVGTASGGSGIKIIDTTDSSTTADFRAFDLSYTGGVHLSASADGHIAVSTHTGDQVKIFDSAGNPTASFFAFDPQYTGGVDVAWLDLTHLALSSETGARINVYNTTTGLMEQSAVVFGNLSGGAHVGTIGDLPAASIDSPTINEGNAGLTDLVFTVSLNHASQSTVSIDYVTQDVSATAASGDYTSTSGTLTFAPGETAKDITVAVHGDTTFEANETFQVQLSNPGNAQFAHSVGLGTIVNDDVDTTTFTEGPDTITLVTPGATWHALDGNDVVTGTSGADTIYGDNDNDTLNGGDGNDTLIGNDDVFASEPDTLDGGNGSDTIFGEPTDTIHGGADTDFLFAVNSNPWDIELGATSIEWMSAGFGNDTIDAFTQTAPVTVFAGGGDDVVTGSPFDDFLWGGVGNDTLNGGDGNDLLFGDLGADKLSGGAGDDTIYADSSDTLIDGGDGHDVLYWTDPSAPPPSDLASRSIEWVQTLSGDATLNFTTSSNDVIAYAGSGNNTVTGGAGNDFLWGEAGNDTLVGNAGNDTLVGGAGADRLTGGAGTDNIYGNVGGGGDGVADTYVFDAGWGTDFVYDFDNGVDKFDMHGSGAANFAALTITDAGPHAQIAFGGNLIVVVGAAGQIDAGDFLF